VEAACSPPREAAANCHGRIFVAPSPSRAVRRTPIEAHITSIPRSWNDPEAASRPWSDAVVAFAIAVVVFVVQLPFRALGLSLLDEGAILQIAANLAGGGTPYVDGVHYAFPAVFYLTAAAFRLGGTSVESARLLTCGVFAIAAAAAYLIVRWFLDRSRAALTVTAMFLVYRVWAYPHWQLVSYSTLAMTMLLLATWVLGASLDPTRVAGVAFAGVFAGLAMLSKQDSGAAGSVALGVGVLMLCRPRVASALAFVGGWLAVVAGTAAVLFATGAGPDFVRHAIVIPIRSALRADYPARPSMWPLWHQDQMLRANPFSYAPPIVVDLYWPTLNASRLYRDTAVVDAALKLVFYLPWAVFLVAGAVCARRALRGRLETARAQRQLLLVLLAAASLAAFNRPQDWPHCLVLYPPTLLLLCSLAAPWARRPAASGLAIAVLGSALVVSAHMALELRRTFDTPVRTPRGVLWGTAAHAQSLQALLDRIATVAPADAPVLSLPYQPLVTFLSARPALSRFVFLWPSDPPEARDAEIIQRLATTPQALVVYSETLAPFLPRLQSFAPTLFRYLVEHYTIDEAFGGGPKEFCFLLLGHRPPPIGTSLLGAAGREARVTVDGGAAPRDVRDLVAEELWPFVPVLRVSTVLDASVSVAYGMVPEPGQRFETRYGINPDHWIDIPPPRARFAIAVRDAGGERELWGAEVDPMNNPHDRRWALASIDLSPWAGQGVDVVLRVTRPRGAPARSELVGWGDPRLVPAGARAGAS
jgi:hypothetical protein